MVAKAIEIFKAKKVRRRKVNKEMPDDIHIISGEGSEPFCQVDILFDTDKKGKITFKVRVDSEWWLCRDGVLRENFELAKEFEKDNVKDGVVQKVYKSIQLRAMEAVGYVLVGRFKKEQK